MGLLDDLLGGLAGRAVGNLPHADALASRVADLARRLGAR
jgi:hypothetical protein